MMPANAEAGKNRRDARALGHRRKTNRKKARSICIARIIGQIDDRNITEAARQGSMAGVAADRIKLTKSRKMFQKQQLPT